MLQAMGWREGSGLGRKCQGITAPIEVSGDGRLVHFSYSEALAAEIPGRHCWGGVRVVLRLQIRGFLPQRLVLSGAGL